MLVMDPISALIGAGASLLGGFMNSQSQQATNAANLQQQMYLANNSVSMRVADANRAGINPLAALGVSTPGFVGATAPEPGAGVAAAGQDLSRATFMNKDKETKADVLNDRLLEAKVALAEGDVAHQTLVNSQLARTFASPGNSNGVPLPMADPRYEPDIKPAMQRFQSTSGVITEPSRSFTESSFSSLPGLGGTPLAATDVVGQNLPNDPSAGFFARPDVIRAINTYGTNLGLAN